jgi:hypothetical protein
MLAAMLAPLPCDVIDLGIVPDDLDAMVAVADSFSDNQLSTIAEFVDGLSDAISATD